MKVEEAKRAAEKEYVLNLVPFGNVPHIPFDNVKYGESAVRTLVVVNRTSKPVHVRKFERQHTNYFNTLYLKCF